MTDLILNKKPDSPTSEPFYDLLNGYYKPEEFSSDPATQTKIKEAMEVVSKLADYLNELELVQ